MDHQKDRLTRPLVQLMQHNIYMHNIYAYHICITYLHSITYVEINFTIKPMSCAAKVCNPGWINRCSLCKKAPVCGSNGITYNNKCLLDIVSFPLILIFKDSHFQRFDIVSFPFHSYFQSTHTWCSGLL